MALGLLLVELRLQFARHFVVALLRLLEVEAHLVHVGERVEVLVLVERTVALLVAAVVRVHVHEDDVLLQLAVLLLEAVLLAPRLLDRDLYQLLSLWSWNQGTRIAFENPTTELDIAREMLQRHTRCTTLHEIAHRLQNLLL